MRGAVLVLCAIGALGCVRSPEARAEGWWSARTAHVHLLSDGGRDQTFAVAARLETLRADVGAAFYRCGAADHDAVVEVIVLSHDEEFDELREGSSGFALRAVSSLVSLPEAIVLSGASVTDGGHADVFAHELTHTRVHACFPDAPPWLNEGLACVFETVRESNGRIVVGEPAYRVSDTRRTISDFANGRYILEVPRVRVPPPTVLTQLDYAAFQDRTDTAAATGAQLRTGRYAAAWALVHMLALGPSTALRARFLAYLEELGRGTRSSVAFSEAFSGVDLDASFDAYVHAGQFATFSRDAPLPIASAPTLQRVSTAEAHLVLATLLFRAHDREAAQAHLAIAESEGPTRARASLLHASIDPERAHAWIARAAAASPDDHDVVRARLDEAAASGSADAEGLVRAMAARTDRDPRDDAALARAEVVLGRPADALVHARAATEAAPGAWWTWIEVCRANIALHDMAAASAALVSLVRTGALEDGNVAAEVRRWRAMIQRASVAHGPDVPTTSP